MTEEQTSQTQKKDQNIYEVRNFKIRTDSDIIKLIEELQMQKDERFNDELAMIFLKEKNIKLKTKLF